MEKWIYINETIRVDEKLFLFGRCYEFTEFQDLMVDCDLKSSRERVRRMRERHYRVWIDEVSYWIPGYFCTVIPSPIEGHELARIDLPNRDYIARTNAEDFFKIWEEATGVNLRVKKSVDKASYANELRYKPMIDAIRKRDRENMKK